METRTFVVDGTMASQVRDLLAARVRLRFSERRDWPWFYMRRFTVTGPASLLDVVAAEISAAEHDQWEKQIW